MNRTTLMVVAIMVTAVPVPVVADSASHLEKVHHKLMTMTVADFEKGTIVEDDGMETVAVVSTAKAYRVNQSILSTTQSDVALKAGIEKKTGRVGYQVHAAIGYSGGWRYYERATFATPSGPEPASLEIIGRDVVDCVSGTCFYSERAAFTIAENTLREVAASYVPGSSPLWRLRFQARQGLDCDEVMSPAEVLSMLNKVDQYLLEHHLARAAINR